VFWLKDKSLADLDNLPDADDLAEDIIENLEAGLEQLPTGTGRPEQGSVNTCRLRLDVRAFGEG